MKSNGFNKYTEGVDLTALSDYCRMHGRLRRYSKGEAFVMQGDVGRYLGFVESGYFKYTTVTTDGNEAVVGFAFAGEGVCDFNNSYCGLPSEVTIVAGCDAAVWQVGIAEAREGILVRLGGLREAVSAAMFREVYGRYLELYRMSPTERYLELLDCNPEIFGVVPLREIASYLRVTPVYLSRIRKKLAENGRL